MLSNDEFCQIEKEARDETTAAILNFFRRRNGINMDCFLPADIGVYVSGRFSKAEIIGSVIRESRLIEPVAIINVQGKSSHQIRSFFRIFGESVAFKHGITYDDLQ